MSGLPIGIYAPEKPLPPHPAKFSDPILAWLDENVMAGTILDPFAGTGRVHELFSVGDPERNIPVRRTWGVEIEPEWAAYHPRTLVGDATRLPFQPRSFDAIVTSPTYGNRMADHHQAQDPCKRCGGSGEGIEFSSSAGIAIASTCSKCDGTGRSKRYTYTHQLGRNLHLYNTGKESFGSSMYELLHGRAYLECNRVLMPLARLYLNVKNFYRNKELVDICRWHCDMLEKCGFIKYAEVAIPVRGMRNGANSDSRVDHEMIYTFIKGSNWREP